MLAPYRDDSLGDADEAQCHLPRLRLSSSRPPRLDRSLRSRRRRFGFAESRPGGHSPGMGAYEEDWGGAVLAVGAVRDHERRAARDSWCHPPAARNERGEPEMTPRASTAVTATGRPATDPAGPTGRLATWVAQTTLADVPASVRDRAKHLVLDGIGCALVGAQLPWSRIGVAGVTALDDAGDSVLVGWGGRVTSATSAAMVNSSF